MSLLDDETALVNNSSIEIADLYKKINSLKQQVDSLKSINRQLTYDLSNYVAEFRNRIRNLENKTYR